MSQLRIQSEEDRLMSTGDQRYRVALFTTLGISLISLLIISSEGGTPHLRIATGQQVSNQTGTAALSANLTQSDFDTLRQDLTEAHRALEGNDTTLLLDKLNSASGELFLVISRQFDPAHVDAMTQEFNPLQNHIDRAQEAALKDNHTGTEGELNAAESELLTIIQMLPSSQE